MQMWQHQGYKTVTFPWIRPTRRELPFRADLMFAAFRGLRPPQDGAPIRIDGQHLRAFSLGAPVSDFVS